MIKQAERGGLLVPVQLGRPCVVHWKRERHHVYMTDDSRMNIAGLRRVGVNAEFNSSGA